ncbi:MAG: tetratricopeptide repeat protein [Thermomicrobiales bacterium]
MATHTTCWATSAVAGRLRDGPSTSRRRPATRSASAAGAARSWPALTGHDYTEAQAQFHRALALARALGEPTALAHSLNRVGNWYANAEQPESSLAYHQEALAIFEQRADLAGRATTLDLLGMASALAGDLVACAHHAAQAITPFRDLGDRQGLIGALLGSTMPAIYETDTLVAAWGPAEASANCAQALALAREIGWRSGEAYALAMVGETLAAQGNYARALDALREGLALAEEIEHPQWAIQTLRGLAGLHTDILALPPAHAEYERALALAREIGSPLWIGDITGALAALLVAQGALADAEAMLGEVLDATTPTRSLGHRQLWCARAELALARGDPALALAILDRLYAAAANLRDEGDIPRLARLKGTALATIGEAERAERLLRGGLRTAEALGLAASRWRLYVALGDLHRQQDRPDDAAHAHMTARRLVAELAAATPEGDLREGFTRAALTLLSPLAARRAAREAHGGLTTREREVAALIARGSTNREIAAALSVGDRTVETHVSNILAKLNCTTRAQIATWATERRLVPPIS